jgi:hypothetical protein
MKKIAASSGFSKASVGRHSLKCCNRKIVEKFKSIKQMIPIVVWPASGPDGPRCHVLFREEKLLSVSEVNRLCDSDYMLWEIRYAPPPTPVPEVSTPAVETLAAPAAALEEFAVGEMLPPREPEEIPSDEKIVFSRAPDEESPIEEKPEPAAQGMRDLLANVKSMITRRRCG